MAGVGGFEPPHGDTKNRCLTAWLHPNKCIYEGKWCRNTDSNRGPDDYKSTALPTELLRRTLFPSILLLPDDRLGKDLTH